MVEKSIIETLEHWARYCRIDALQMAEACGSGHLGGALSVMDVLVALYFEFAKIDPRNPEWEERDRIIFSKAHACEALYAVLGERGYFPSELFKTFGEWGSKLQGHSERWAMPGVEYSGGSLGQGLSYACGVALAGKLHKKNYRVFCILGDGECHEGQVWEAAMFASQYHLGNLIAIVDSNGFCSDNKPIESVIEIEPLVEKWTSFNWADHTIVNGNNMKLVCDGLKYVLGFAMDAPKIIIAKTTKGKGIPIWEALHPHLVYGKMLQAGLAEAKMLFD